MTKMYGIKNCDTIKKAKKWLEQHNIAFAFVDYRTDGLSESELSIFAAACGWQQLLNTRGTTYRQLTDEQKSAMTEVKALSLMLAQPAMIKRPLLEHNGNYYLGFSDNEYQRIFG